MKQQEGKIPLLKSHFEFIAQKTMQSPKDFNLNMFAHLFLTLTWSLIARSASTALAGFSMFGWSGDAMTLKLPKSKCAIVDFIQIRCLLKFEFAFLVLGCSGDQSGKNAIAKHVFASPLPSTCPILSLAIWTFTLPTTHESVFGKECAEKKFRQWFKAFIVEHHNEMQQVGINCNEIGM